MSDDLLVRLNDLADARHDDLEVAAEAATRIISLAWEINDAQTRIESLEEENIALMEAGQLITGWREFNHPEWFCRRTAQLLADYWRESAPPMKVREE